MNEFEKLVLKTISEQPGVKIADIMETIKCDRKDVISALHGVLKEYCFQDSSYRWYINNRYDIDKNIDRDSVYDKQLADLCKYYLNCLSLEESNGVSAFLNSASSLNYAELTSLNVDGSDNNVSYLVRKVSSEKNLTAHVGYPISINKVHSSKTNKDYLIVVPVFLFPVEISGGSVYVESIPHINIEIIKQYSSRDINSQVYDLVDLENELGLNNQNTEINLDEMTARLQSIREWQWKENLDPINICNTPKINEITEEGIYNKSIFIVTEKSPYTIGLESELSQLSQLKEDSYRGTALYDWVHKNITFNEINSSNDIPLLEVLSMNSEQEQTILHAENNKLTIVTGPPGTGKSQIVTNLLINASWNGKSVLFTSKNNKAVDVVESRVNSIGCRPIMLRIGGNQYAYHLAELLSDLISCSIDKNDQQEYKLYMSLYHDKIVEYQNLKKKKDNIIEIRNHVDHMEKRVCELREKWGKWFGEISEEEVRNFEFAFEQYCTIFNSWYNLKNSYLGKLFWFAVGNRKTNELNTSLEVLNEFFIKYDQSAYCKYNSSSSYKNHDRIYNCGETLVYILKTINEYVEAFHKLSDEPNFEDIDRELIRIKADLANLSKKLWDKWLTTHSLNISADLRYMMNEYVSAMRLIGDVDLSEYPDIRRKFNHLQQKMSLFLPCWAVTSLSAKGRIPFQPGMFDLVVIDEASQCDIPSVLPMLYRAKRAVIIGDPKQLSHITTVSKTQDLNLLQKYSVDMGWSYSANSLYSRARSLADPNHIIQLRDHHRSFADIIEFSNTEFYDSKLRVATNYDKLKCPSNIKPGIHWIDIVGKAIRPTSGGLYNDSEVVEIIEGIKDLVINNKFKGTVGVVTPFRAQAERIRKALSMLPELSNALLNNEFLVDTVHKFQGDERDLMFFSPVISQGTSKGALDFLRNTGNLFNVAITRARSVLVVVGDLNYCSDCGITYMEHFVNHVNRVKMRENSKIVQKEMYPTTRIYPKVSNPEQVSEWERLFYTVLFDCGIRTIPQYPVDKYKLDLAIIDGDRMLDIEIDGEFYHKDWTGELSYRDQLRNQRLFELGWDVKRFWVYQLRDELPSCVEQIKKWIQNS